MKGGGAWCGPDSVRRITFRIPSFEKATGSPGRPTCGIANPRNSRRSAADPSGSGRSTATGGATVGPASLSTRRASTLRRARAGGSGWRASISSCCGWKTQEVNRCAATTATGSPRAISRAWPARAAAGEEDGHAIHHSLPAVLASPLYSQAEGAADAQDGRGKTRRPEAEGTLTGGKTGERGSHGGSLDSFKRIVF